MIITKSITLILKKSNRKNSKALYKFFTKADAEKYTIPELREILSIIIANKKEYCNVFFKFGVNGGFLSQKRYSFEQNMNDLFDIMQGENKENFNINKSELHMDKNIAFLIKRYYEA